MVTLFSEEDLISFGQYILSDVREESIIKNPEIKSEEQKQVILKSVTPFDYNNWVRIRLSERDTPENSDVIDPEIPTNE